MKFNKRTFALTAGLILVAGYAFAQATIPQVQNVDPNADRIQVIPQSGPSAQSVYASPAQITVTQGYYKSTPLTGFNFTFSNSQKVAAFTPAGTLAGGYVTFAPNPSDGTEQCVFSTAAVTLFYPQANTGQTITNAATTLAANTRQCYEFQRANSLWFRTL